GSEDARPIRPARPTADARVLGDLCRRAVEERPLSAPLAGVRLEAAEEAAPRADQLDAFRAPAPDPAALHAGLLPVFARWGDGALSRAVLQGAHLPAEHARWEPLGAAGIAGFASFAPSDMPAGKAPGIAAEGGLGLCLRRLPEPLPARVRIDARGRPAGLEVQAAPSVAVREQGGGYPPGLWKTRAEGPERVSGLWWRGATAREYWRMELEEGWLGLVYRDAATGGWHLEGWYD
ncbi:MAG: polymerase IV-like protein ImuB, partial [Gemmatimonadetes bacterium]|nr:polymerase IV-like protein ImuB [Gemmatimonadota bacterium]